MTILVTGGAGFIGSNLLHNLIDIYDNNIICIDSLTYAANEKNIPNFIKLYPYDISNKEFCDEIFYKHKPKYVFHLAAESHVDNSIKDCSPFIHTNIIGTVNLLTSSVKYEVDKFIQFAKDNPHLTFLVTEVGCGLAGFTVEQVAPLFKPILVDKVSNVRLPKKFVRELIVSSIEALL